MRVDFALRFVGSCDLRFFRNELSFPPPPSSSALPLPCLDGDRTLPLFLLSPRAPRETRGEEAAGEERPERGRGETPAGGGLEERKENQRQAREAGEALTL